MKRVYLIIAVLLPLLMASCGKNQYTVTFQLGADQNSSYRLLAHASSNRESLMIETVVGIQAGKGTVKMSTRYPTVVFVFRGSEPQPITTFYAEKGDEINITGGTEPLEWKITGNKLNEALTAWRLENKEILQRRDVKGINGAVAKYVKGHKEEPLSAYLLMTVYNRYEGEEEFSTLWKSLGDKAKPPRLMAALSRADMEEAMNPTTNTKASKRPTIILHTDSAHISLNLKNKQGALLYFGGFAPDDLQTIDSLKKMSEIAGYPGDSGRYVVANIFLEPDSMSWIRTMRDDTIKGLVRGWIPLSYNDESIKAFDIRRTKYFIVTDSGGAIKYRGEDAGRATTEFRKIVRR